MSNPGPPGQAPSQVASRFLHLLRDVNRIHGLFQEEIAELKARVKELEEANTSLAASFLPDVRGCAIYMVSPDGRIQGWSGGASELYGYSVEEILGQPADLLEVGPEGAGLKSGPVAPGCPASALRTRKDGGIFEVFPHHMTLVDAAGRPSGSMRVEVPAALGRGAARPPEGRP